MLPKKTAHLPLEQQCLYCDSIAKRPFQIRRSLPRLEEKEACPEYRHVPFAMDSLSKACRGSGRPVSSVHFLISCCIPAPRLPLGGVRCMRAHYMKAGNELASCSLHVRNVAQRPVFRRKHPGHLPNIDFWQCGLPTHAEMLRSLKTRMNNGKD